MNKEAKWIFHGKQGPSDGKLIKWVTVLMRTSDSFPVKEAFY